MGRAFVMAGIRINATSTSSNVSIAVDPSSGKYPVQVAINATGSGAYIKVSNNVNAVATTADLLVQPGDSIVLNIHMMQYVAAKSVASASVVSVASLSTGLWSSDSYGPILTALPPAPSQSQVAAIFSGRNGGFYDMSDASTLYSDPGLTTLAAVGQIVRGVRDLSGNGNHQIDNNNQSQFVRDNSSGFNTISGNGTGWGLWQQNGNNFGSSQGYTFYSAYNKIGVDRGDPISADGYTSRAAQGLIVVPNTDTYPNANGTVFFDSSGNATGLIESVSRSLNTNYVAGSVADSSGGKMFVNGTNSATISHPQTLAPFSNVILTLGATEEGSSTPSRRVFNGRISCALAIGVPLSASERATVEAYFASRMA